MNDFVHSEGTIPREQIDDGQPMNAGDVFEVLPDGTSRRVDFNDLPEAMQQMVRDIKAREALEQSFMEEDFGTPRPPEPETPMPEPPPITEGAAKVAQAFKRLENYIGRKVQGRCPTCEREELLLDPSGHVVCSSAECEAPEAASVLLAPEGVNEVKNEYDGFTMFLFGAGSAVHRFWSQTYDGCVDLLAAHLRGDEERMVSYSYTFVVEPGRVDLADLAKRKQR